MKEKIITIKPKGISQKQWANFLLELKLIKKAWKPYATLNLHAHSIRKIIENGSKKTTYES